MSASHIVKSYDQELTTLVSYAVKMGSLVEQQFQKAIEAIHARDNAIAGHAFESDSKVDELEHALNDLGLKMLALRQPMAGDLRLIIGSMRIARDLERIGDYAANLAKRSRTLNSAEKIGLTKSIVYIANLVLPALHNIVAAYAHNDVTSATEVCAQDDVIDAAYNSLIEDLIQYMQHNPQNIKTCTHLLFMAKNLERIGDRVTNIAETVHFIVDGTIQPPRKKKIIDRDVFPSTYQEGGL